MNDTETKTILHYAKKIKEYCKTFETCVNCPVGGAGKQCYFYDLPYLWEEVNLHDERQHMDTFTTDN